MVRHVLDGRQADIPVAHRATIVNVLRYQQLHSVCGTYAFQLRRYACAHPSQLGRRCGKGDYPFAPNFHVCEELDVPDPDIAPFLDEPLVDEGTLPPGCP